MVDSVMIDPAYDGNVFNTVLTDLPERKQDLVRGRYELQAPKGKTVVAVKVTDKQGEELLVQHLVSLSCFALHEPCLSTRIEVDHLGGGVIQKARGFFADLKIVS